MKKALLAFVLGLSMLSLPSVSPSQAVIHVAKKKPAINHVGDVQFAKGSSVLTRKGKSTIRGFLRKYPYPKKNLWSSISYIPLKGATSAQKVLGVLRQQAVANYLIQLQPRLALRTYQRPLTKIQPGSKAYVLQLNKVNLYNRYDPKAVPSGIGTLSLGGTFNAVNRFDNDDIYVTAVNLSGPIKPRSVSVKGDANDNDLTHTWKFLNLPAGAYTIILDMRVRSVDACLSLLQGRPDQPDLSYGGISNGFYIDPTDEFCHSNSTFSVFKQYTLKTSNLRQNFTIGYADLLN